MADFQADGNLYSAMLTSVKVTVETHPLRVWKFVHGEDQKLLTIS